MSETKTKYRVLGTRPVRHDGVDKVTGRANYGADFHLPGMLHGRVLRSPHAHARIKSIDTSAAAALEGVLAVVTGDDFPAEVADSVKVTAQIVMSRGHVRYSGHAVAAVAASSLSVAEQALALIKVDYEVLPHVTDVMAAAKNEVVIDPEVRTNGEESSGPTNICMEDIFGGGDLDAGFAAADLVIEREFDSATIHQGYIEPHACVARHSEDGQNLLWVSSQGHFAMRDQSADVLGIRPSKIKVIPAEIGGGFGGKTNVYLEPVAILLAQKTGRPVKMVMSREEIFTATGPAPGSHIRIKVGATKAGRITAVDADMWFECGGFTGFLLATGMQSLIAPYNVENFRIKGYNVLVNKPYMRPYRAPLSPNAAHASETVLDEICEQIGMDPFEFRLANAAKKGTRAVTGLPYEEIGMIETVQAARTHPHYSAPLGPNQGRGVACGFWMNFGGDATANMTVLNDGRLSLITGRPDIGGSRAAQAMVLAEELGIEVDQVIPSIGDTDTVGNNGISEGSSTAFATSLAIHKAAAQLIEVLRDRAAQLWEVKPEQVSWLDGAAHLKAGSNGSEKSLNLEEIAAGASKTGGPIGAEASLNAKSAAPAFGAHICDVEVDPETGKVDVIRYTVAQDAGRALHMSYVEGQLQGGAAQGIGWALNEGYFYDEHGTLQNPGFLDYRMPVALDLPMIDTVVVEVPNPRHPLGVRGVGENAIAAPLPAVANAIHNAVGVRLRQVPMSPPRVLAAIMEQRASQPSAAQQATA
jgi:CO/xanthine dehydrogenase Mo-binding subunit